MFSKKPRKIYIIGAFIDIKHLNKKESEYVTLEGSGVFGSKYEGGLWGGSNVLFLPLGTGHMCVCFVKFI